MLLEIRTNVVNHNKVVYLWGYLKSRKQILETGVFVWTQSRMTRLET